MSTNRRRSTSTTRKNLQLPSSLTSDICRIFHHITLVFCRRFIFSSIKWKILIHFSLIILGPFLKEARIFPISLSVAIKINSFNKYVSQLGWMSSICFLIPFVYLTSLIYARGHYGLIVRHLIRLLIATSIWYSLRWLFARIEILTGSCQPPNHQKKSCRYSWHDGQTFLYLYAVLVINEEVKLYDENWRKVELASLNRADSSATLLNQTRLRLFSIPISFLYFILALLTTLWELMLLTSAVYFYNIFHKLFAVILSVFSWLITYHFWFRHNSGSLFSPCSPGDGFVTF